MSKILEHAKLDVPNGFWIWMISHQHDFKQNFWKILKTLIEA